MRFVRVNFLGLLFFHSFVNVMAQNSASEILNNEVHSRLFTIGSEKIFLKEITIKNDNSAWDGLKFGWIEIPQNISTIQISELNSNIETKSKFKSLSNIDDIVITNGGFWKEEGNRQLSEGLIIINSQIKQPIATYWKEGGILAQEANGSFIIPIKAAKYINLDRLKYAIQSKPLVTSNSKNGISKKDASRRSNRIGIGMTYSGNTIICYAVNSNNYALTMFEFGEILAANSKPNSLGIQNFLALDGGPSVSIYIPSLNYHIGSEKGYFPNIIHIRKK